jgi:hypothetical protein
MTAQAGWTAVAIADLRSHKFVFSAWIESEDALPTQLFAVAESLSVASDGKLYVGLASGSFTREVTFVPDPLEPVAVARVFGKPGYAALGGPVLAGRPLLELGCAWQKICSRKVESRP